MIIRKHFIMRLLLLYCLVSKLMKSLDLWLFGAGRSNDKGLEFLNIVDAAKRVKLSSRQSIFGTIDVLLCLLRVLARKEEDVRTTQITKMFGVRLRQYDLPSITGH